MKHFLVPPKEDYVCEHCGARVAGGRYNNHCPKCLWSKHVDEVVPGDRKSGCLGMMKPIGAEMKGGKCRVVQKCEKCGKKFTVDIRAEDNFDEVVRLSGSRRQR